MSSANAAPAAIFWDMDGTLINTEPLWAEATFELSEKLGRRLSPEERKKTEGASFAESLGICARWAGYELANGEQDELRAWMYQRMAEKLAGGIELNPGIRPLLEQLCAAGVPMFVTTNTERTLADRCIAAIGAALFTDSITGDEVTRPKPAPDMYEEAARRVGAPTAECLVVEDSWTGMSAAAASGCRVLGLGDPVPSGVYQFDPARFVGATAEDLFSWFATAAREVH
ncbi:HAD family phosphatase [Corynebacterium sp. NML 150383]|uniref:HAD family hydrolase n=1 Tax=Corynebacterium sp. NML 150383 TaxID=2029400 RepID=UPI002100C8E8|nr:HAD family phosphatase [Corynebacterium sp. NML 150383]